eukprot:TRINITY_DN12520_c0_g1_i1.p1 TRINITY_DN12520_c0_g1~~TRINITY_DN12520_c0_g1_i1.p1  ORF type:complete len:444 (+),score=81.53 TRINITY_DN12520_c0_g1_i1:42-1334(+)
MSVRELKAFIISRGGDPTTCSEKSELVALAKELSSKATVDGSGPLSHQYEVFNLENVDASELPSDEDLKAKPVTPSKALAYGIQEIKYSPRGRSSGRLVQYFAAIVMGATMDPEGGCETGAVLASKSLGSNMIRSYSAIKDHLRYFIALEKPEFIFFDDDDIFQELRYWLRDQIGVQARFQASIPGIKKFVDEMTHMASQVDPGLIDAGTLLDVPGATEELVKEFYAAATYFYKQAPWTKVDNLQSIGVKVGDSEEKVIALMGWGGQEFGMTVYQSAEVWKWFLTNSQNMSPEMMMEYISKGVNTLSYESLDSLRVQDVTLAMTKGWELPGDPFKTRTFPTPRQVTMEATEKTPPLEWIVFYVAVTRTLPSFVNQLQAIVPYDPVRSLKMFESSTKTYSINIPGKENQAIQVSYRYPAAPILSYQQVFGF